MRVLRLDPLAVLPRHKRAGLNRRHHVRCCADASPAVPIDWPEPFGLVMIEAMACGTPVIAFRSGSVPEVIDEGVTGFVVDDEEQAVQAVKRLVKLDRRRVRERFEKRFMAGRMAADYLSHYQSVVNGGSAEARNKGRLRVKRARLLPPDRVRLVSEPVELHSALRSSGTSPNLRITLGVFEIASGRISTCPIALYPATSEKEAFNQLNRRTGRRIKSLKVDADTGDEVSNQDTLDTETFVEILAASAGGSGSIAAAGVVADRASGRRL